MGCFARFWCLTSRRVQGSLDTSDCPTSLTLVNSHAIVLEAPGDLRPRQLQLHAGSVPEAVVEVAWTGISAGTERLLYRGEMPAFPGMGYPLVPGYETVGRVLEAPKGSTLNKGDSVFVPGATCFGEVRGLFGGAASRLLVPPDRLVPIDEDLGSDGVLLALAATAQHAIERATALPDLVVGHGTLGRLLARLTVAAGGSPVVWEKNPSRMDGAQGYSVVSPEDDERRDYVCIVDASGDTTLLDTLIGRLKRRGELVLAGFYSRVDFAFPLAFMKEATFLVAAEWDRADMDTVLSLLAKGSFSLSDLITHRKPFHEAAEAYPTAFNDSRCLKMALDWRDA